MVQRLRGFECFLLLILGALISSCSNGKGNQGVFGRESTGGLNRSPASGSGSIVSWLFEDSDDGLVTVARLSSNGGLENKVLIFSAAPPPNKGWPYYGPYPLRQYLRASLRTEDDSGFLGSDQLPGANFGDSWQQTLINNNSNAFRFWVGTNYQDGDPVYEKLKPYLQSDSILKQDGFILALDRNTLQDFYIVGMTPAATQMGQYYFLNKFAGVKLFGPPQNLLNPEFPASRHSPNVMARFEGFLDHVPQLSELSIDPTMFPIPEGAQDSSLGVLVVNPAFDLRFFSEETRSPFYHWLLNFSGSGTHAMTGWFRPLKLPNGAQTPQEFNAVPGYYSGNVVPALGSADWQVCFSYPGDENAQPRIPSSAEAAAKSILEFLKYNPQTKMISLGGNDVAACSRDKTLSSTGGGEQVVPYEERTSVAVAYLKFVNSVISYVRSHAAEYELPAELISKLKFRALVYGATSGDLPEGMNFDPQVLMTRTIDSSHAHEEGQLEEAFGPNGDLAKIVNRGSQVEVYEYSFGGGFLIPRAADKVFWQNIRNKYGHPDNVTSFYAEAYPNYALDGPKHWIAAQLLWDPSLDPEHLMDEYFLSLYGEEGLEIKTLWKELQSLWMMQLTYDGAAARTEDHPEGRFFEGELNLFNKSNFRFFQTTTQFLTLDIQKFEEIVNGFQRVRDQIAENGGPGHVRRLERLDFVHEALKLSLLLQKRQRLVSMAQHSFVDGRLDLAKAMRVLSQWVSLPDFRQQVDRVLSFDRSLTKLSKEMLESVERIFPVEAVLVANNAFVTQTAEQRRFCSRSDFLLALQQTIRSWGNENADPEVQIGDAARDLVFRYASERGFLMQESGTIDFKVGDPEIGVEWGEPQFDGNLNDVYSQSLAAGSFMNPAFEKRESNRTMIWMKYDPSKRANFLAFRLFYQDEDLFNQLRPDGRPKEKLYLSFVDRPAPFNIPVYGYNVLAVDPQGLHSIATKDRGVFPGLISFSGVTQNTREKYWQFKVMILDKSGAYYSPLVPERNRNRSPGLNDQTILSIARYRAPGSSANAPKFSLNASGPNYKTELGASTLGVIPYRNKNGGFEANAFSWEWQADGPIVVPYDSSCTDPTTDNSNGTPVFEAL